MSCGWLRHSPNPESVLPPEKRTSDLPVNEYTPCPQIVAEVAWMKPWMLGNAAVMRADQVMPGNRRPPYRATRVWVRRDGHWQMAVSQQTTMGTERR